MGAATRSARAPLTAREADQGSAADEGVHPTSRGTIPPGMAEEKPNVWSQVSRYSELAFILPSGALAGWLIGYLLDKLFHTHFLYLVFLGLGFIGGFVQLIRTVLKEVGPGTPQ